MSVPASPAIEPEREGRAPEESIPHLLDDHGRRTLGVLAEQLVPGSSAAGVVDLLDRVMAVEAVDEQRRFLSAIGAFEHASRERYAKGFLEIDTSLQLEILRAASTLPPARPPSPGWTKGHPVERANDGPPPPSNLRDHFDHLRALVARSYYATEPGMKELGFANRMAFSSLPGCLHSGDDHGR
jgi:hypothetical protein